MTPVRKAEQYWWRTEQHSDFSFEYQKKIGGY